MTKLKEEMEDSARQGLVGRFRWITSILWIGYVLFGIITVLLWLKGKAFFGSSLFLFSTIWIIGKLGVKKLAPKRQEENIMLCWSVFMIMVVVVEVLVRIMGIGYPSYSEENGKNYSSVYTKDKRINQFYSEYGFHGLLVHHPFSTKIRNKPEFKQTVNYNELGLRERPTDQFIDSTKRVIVALGDSFTEGVGTPTDQTWEVSMEKRLNQSGHKNFMVYNAGSSGSDVFFEYNLLLRLLKEGLRPEVVILMVNGTDISDVILKGGEERFRPTGEVKYTEPPYWEFFYAGSHLVRMFVRGVLKYDSNLLSEERGKIAESIAIKSIQQKITNDFISLSGKTPFKLCVVFQPLNWECSQNNKWYDTMRNDVKLHDIWTISLDSIIDEGKIDCQDLYWEKDGHFKPEGYEFIGRKMAEHLIRRQMFEEDS